MGYKLNIFVPTPDTTESLTLPSGSFTCPVCDGVGCEFCDFTGEVSAERLSTYEVDLGGGE